VVQRMPALSSIPRKPIIFGIPPTRPIPRKLISHHDPPLTMMRLFVITQCDLGNILSRSQVRACDVRKAANVLDGGQTSSKIASTSTATSLGSNAQPTAERACFPASPRAATMSSDAPSITAGWSVNSGIAFTNVAKTYATQYSVEITTCEAV